MKKSVLSLAVAAGVTGVMSAAHADMYINDNGTGEALIYPFYSAQNGNVTSIHVVNTTGVAKAVKVRILEAENSDEVLDFNLYMSPEDHFAFGIAATEDGGAKLITTDSTCTVPQIPSAGNADLPALKEVDFRNFEYAEDKGTTFDNTSISRTAIGYVEVIEMGQIPMATSGPYTDLLHNATTGIPADCGDLVDFWAIRNGVPGAWLADVNTAGSGDVADTGFATSWNGGGLYGFGSVINVAEGTAFGYDAVAIDGLVDPSESGFALHYEPGDTRPDFTDSALANTALVEVAGNSVQQVFGTGEEIFAVNSLFMATEVINDYIIDPNLAAATDWVITMPTKFQHVNAGSTVASVVPPFTAPWNGQTSCEEIGFSFFNREEQSVIVEGDPDFSPPPPTPTTTVSSLCYEMTVVQFGDESAVDAKDVVLSVNAPIDAVGFNEGWATVSFPTTVALTGANQRVLTPDAGVVQNGLPVTGIAAVKYTNGTLGGGATLANYAFATEHKTTVATSAIGS